MSPNLAKAVSVFKPINNAPSEQNLSFQFDGKPLTASPGMSVAAALLAHGVLAFRNSPVSGNARGPYCMMGACYDCLVVIDGVCVQACMTPVSEALVVSRVPADSLDAL